MSSEDLSQTLGLFGFKRMQTLGHRNNVKDRLLWFGTDFE